MNDPVQRVDSSGCAFPIGDSRGAIDAGMTLRDYFAAVAVGGIVSGGGLIDPVYVSAQAYKVADAMLKERTK